MRRTRTPADRLHGLRQLDAAHAACPSDILLDVIHDFERAYTAATGEPCPTRKDRTAASEADPREPI